MKSFTDFIVEARTVHDHQVGDTVFLHKDLVDEKTHRTGIVTKAYDNEVDVHVIGGGAGNSIRVFKHEVEPIKVSA